MGETIIAPEALDPRSVHDEAEMGGEDKCRAAKIYILVCATSSI